MVGSSSREPIAAASKYCSQSICYENPAERRAAFAAQLADACSLYRIDVLLPLTDVTVPIVINDVVADIRIGACLPSTSAYDAASDKDKLAQLARQLGHPVPSTRSIPAGVPLPPIAELRFPVVLKPTHSRVVTGEHIVATRVLIARDAYELDALLASIDWLGACDLLLQEFVDGHGEGVFALYEHGRPIAFFAHRRLREKPPQGGVSVLSEAREPDGRMRTIAESLLTTMGWHGPAMVEFRVAADGSPYLMEINGRLWGSLQLAVDAGFDVPALMVEMALGNAARPAPTFESGTRNRWLLGDLDHLLLQLRGKGTALSAGEKLRSLATFLRFPGRNTRLEVLRLGDLRPFLRELKQWFAAALGRSNA